MKEHSNDRDKAEQSAHQRKNRGKGRAKRVWGVIGTIVLVGMTPQACVEFNFQQIMMKEIQIKSVFRYRNLYPTAIAAISSGSIDLKKIVSHEFTFEETNKAFTTVVKEAADVVKAVIKY